MMPRVDKTMLLAVLAGAAIAAVSASCANSCSGHGSCGSHDRCTCYSMWSGTDCSKKLCPSGPSFIGDGYEVCSGRGVCDTGSGTCACSDGYTSYNCGRTACPNDCSGHGKCSSAGVDGGMTRACVCDGYYSGTDCSFRQCPRGDDPLTTEIECKGVSSGSQSHEIQEITLTADKQLSGEMTLTYTDAYGQAWTTMPIGVGGDLEFDLRMSGAGGCSLKYTSATLTPEKFRASGDDSTTDTHDFGATEFTVPGILAGAMTATDCDELTAAQMEALLELNGAVKNVKVTKSGDASAGTARFHVSIGDVNFQNENDGMEIGLFSMTGRADADFHSAGDRSQAIKDALQALPYKVVPSVDVSRVKVDGGSDFADSTVVFGNMVQQKYRVTFSDAANAGDQVSLQCNAEGCDADGCAPRYKGVTHKRYISTKYGSDPMDPTGGVTDYRTAIVATGQGSWWLRSHSLDVRTKSPFTSGTYYVHWDLGNGRTSSASFAYNADQTAIQTALRTIEGWSGVSVSCYGTAGFAGRDYTGVAEAHFGLECKVTYAKGFEDGGKLPTMTYDNIFQGMQSAVDSTSKPTHFTDLGKHIDQDFNCVNEMCLIKEIGYIDGLVGSANGDYTSKALFRGATGVQLIPADGIGNKIAKQDNWIGYVYIRHTDAAGVFPLEGTYEIVRVGSSSELYTHGMTDLIIYAPGVADCTKDEAFQTSSGIGKNIYLYKATPLMPMWPSFSNSIALHDSSFRLIYSPESGNALSLKKAVNSDTPPDSLVGDDRYWGFDGSHSSDVAKPNANLHFGPFGTTIAATAVSAGLIMHPGLKCDAILERLNALGGETKASSYLSTVTTLGTLNTPTGGTAGTATPYPSLAAADGTSICDCRRTTMEVAPFEVEYTITCPGWLGYMLNNDAVEAGAQTDTTGLKSSKLTGDASLIHPITATDDVVIFTHHRRLSPERSLEQLVAVGDTVTVTASGGNTNKQFKVKSFAYDNMWGDGNKGSAIWSAKAGYLGGDDAEGFGTKIGALSPSIDYVSYGDFVPFLKVDPAPSDDYLVTEMFTEGTNGTHFTRTLEDVSTSLAETATLKVYDMPATEGTDDRATNVYANAALLTGTFQVIYDGEVSPVMPVTSSANQVMQYLSQMTSLAHVPVVKKYAGSHTPTVALADTTEAVAANADYVSWSFTFDPRLGDAKKLTFKFTDALGDEQRTSAIKGSGDTYLRNEVKSLLNEGTAAKIALKKIRHVSNKIVMSYSAGSTFYDAIDAEYNGDGSVLDGHTVDDKVQDELAMDVVPGTTFAVSSAEVHHMYMYQTKNEAAEDDNTEPILGCLEDDVGTNANGNPHIVLEYQGAFSAPVTMCGIGGNSQWTTTTLMVDAIEGDLTALKGISVNVGVEVETTNIDTSNIAVDANLVADFQARFPWAATHSGNVRVRVSFTLPMGADGDSFKVHFQRGASKGSGIERYTDDAVKNNEFKIFTHRERNNNGRTFTVTKAYENKVSDLLSVSRIGAYDADGGGLAGALNGVVCGSGIAGAMNPGTYYNVPLIAASPLATAGAGAKAMVVVDGAGNAVEFQITSGGTNKHTIAAAHYIVDTRLHADMDKTDANKRCTVTHGDLTDSKEYNHVLKSVMSGANTGQTCGTLVVGNTCTGDAACNDATDAATCTGLNALCVFASGCGTYGQASGGADAATAFKVHNVPNAQVTTDMKVTGMRYSLECATTYAPTKITVTAGGGTSKAVANTNRAELNVKGTAATGVTSATLGAADAIIGSGAGAAEFATDCTNDHYYQFGFYSTGTPRWNRDLMHNNADMGLTVKDGQVSLYGMKNHMQYQAKSGSAKMATDNFFGLGRDTFTDLNNGIGTYQAGYSVQELENDDTAQFTASVIAGENGQGANGVNLAPMMEHAEKYAYIGKGYDRLTVTPMPDAMTGQKVTITYTGPSAGCSVTEVDRGTHESSECSGRGNCDYSSGTCLCDAGYTLEACSEQTVLV